MDFRSLRNGPGSGLLDVQRVTPYKAPVPKPFLRLGQYLLIVAMFAACGGHWVVLRSVAWSSMMLEYSRTASWNSALKKTFDGKHPCSMCVSIEKVQKSEGKKDSLVVVKKFHLFLVSTPVIDVLKGEIDHRPALQGRGESRSERPAVPPPRVA